MKEIIEARRICIKYIKFEEKIKDNPKGLYWAGCYNKRCDNSKIKINEVENDGTRF